MRRTCLLLLFAASTLAFAHTPQAAAPLSASDVKVVYNFGQQITFAARLSAPRPILRASLLFRTTSEQTTRVVNLSLAPDGSTSYRYDASAHLIPPFATLMFSYQATLADGENVVSTPFYFRYDDNRFAWKTLGDSALAVHWYDGDTAFGQAALDAARTGVQELGSWLPAPPATGLDVYIYSTSDDLQSALTLGGQTWIAGEASPALSVAMVSVAPGDSQTIQLKREIPHELAHILLYRSVGDGYARLPAWLNEGIASLAELYPNPDYARALSVAGSNNTLLSFSDLCVSFPADSGRAFLAYAESQSFVRFLRDNYGETGLTALIKSYADGLSCDLGATRAVGASLAQLEVRWRESVLGEDAAGVAARNLLPYVVLLGLMLIVPVWGAIGAIRKGRNDAGKN